MLYYTASVSGGSPDAPPPAETAEEYVVSAHFSYKGL